jgi:hypothetical protein
VRANTVHQPIHGRSRHLGRGGLRGGAQSAQAASVTSLLGAVSVCVTDDEIVPCQGRRHEQRNALPFFNQGADALVCIVVTPLVESVAATNFPHHLQRRRYGTSGRGPKRRRGDCLHFAHPSAFSLLRGVDCGFARAGPHESYCLTKHRVGVLLGRLNAGTHDSKIDGDFTSAKSFVC